MNSDCVRWIRVWIQWALGAVYPPRCPFCDGLLEQEDAVWFHPVYQKKKTSGAGIHASCRKKLIRITGPVCMRCGRPLESEREEYCYDCARREPGTETFRQARALYRYEDATRKMMYRFKYANRREYGAFFAVETQESLSWWIRRIRPQAILAVPMYRKKERRRGYNQAAVYGRELSRITGIPWAGNGIRRVKDTPPLKKLRGQERRAYLKDAFAASDLLAEYRRVLVVDDIYTTGSTAEETATALRRAGVEEVFFLFICTGKNL